MTYSSILITGASSGIGKKLAELLSTKKTTLCLLGRNQERLEEVKKICTQLGATVYIHAVDITDKEAVEKIVLDFHDKHPIDLVIANAGIGTAQSAKQNKGHVNHAAVIKTNILGIHHTLDPLIPLFKEKGKGQIAIMSSLASYRGFAKYYIYSGTKAYSRVYGQGLRLDLKRYNVKVSTVLPGFVKTPLTDANEFKMPFIMSADKACRIILKGLKKNKSIIAFPLIFNFLTRFIASLPTPMADKLAERFA